ncbi:hypothetical protein [uncultured Megasphaera sp.]|uniref:hypothetical protein n=1 Tax=uncultured Megasphaera sp. TaxID=165188 RepID=UPI002868ABDD|nr:hypothetical protein [uncultured Megasphaera sp.]
MDAETNIYRDSFFAALQRLNAGEIGDTPLTEEDGERIILEGAANILDQKVEKGSLQKKDVTSQPEYVQPLVDYVEEDFTAFRLIFKVIPSPDILQNFAKTMKPIHQRMITNKQENRRLTQLRDFLLPLLMNGQVTFK